MTKKIEIRCVRFFNQERFDAFVCHRDFVGSAESWDRAYRIALARFCSPCPPQQVSDTEHARLPDAPKE
jgi:hypothetical protein